MDNAEIKKFIAEKVAEGISLSKIQDELTAQGTKMTFMELRLLASEIENDIFKQQEAPAEPAPEEAPAPQEAPAEEMPGEAPAPAPAPEEASADDNKLRGNTTVTVSPIQRPGYYATGTVKFGSGAEAEWFLDQSGRLGLDPTNDMKPDQQDIAEFQQELRKAFGA